MRWQRRRPLRTNSRRVPDGDFIIHPHGTNQRYRDECRCDLCRAAHAKHMREYRARIKAQVAILREEMTA